MGSFCMSSVQREELDVSAAPEENRANNTYQ